MLSLKLMVAIMMRNLREHWVSSQKDLKEIDSNLRILYTFIEFKDNEWSLSVENNKYEYFNIRWNRYGKYIKIINIENGDNYEKER